MKYSAFVLVRALNDLRGESSFFWERYDCFLHPLVLADTMNGHGTKVATIAEANGGLVVGGG